MNIKYLLLFLFLFTIRGISFSQENRSSNLSEINKLIEESLIPLENKLILLGKEKLYLLSDESKSIQGDYILKILKRNLSGYKILLKPGNTDFTDSIDYIIKIAQPSIKTLYKKIFDEDIIGTKKVEREITVKYDLTLEDKKNLYEVFRNKFSNRNKDSFNLDEQSVIEDRNYDFSRSAIPEENTVNHLLYPALIIISTAAAIILFFTIRSN